MELSQRHSQQGSTAMRQKRPNSMFEALEAITSRPAPYEFYTAPECWADEHTSQKMLDFHLHENAAVAAREQASIKRSAKWICSHFKINANSSVIVFGCGPGEYTTHFAKKKAAVTGVDFSAPALAFARDSATLKGLEIAYIRQNYLEFTTEKKLYLS